MSSTIRRSAGLAAAALAVLTFSVDVSNRALDDWPQWRGTKRDGMSQEKGLLKTWPKEGPPSAWRASGAGAGYSS
ncbi:MAG: polyvinylalcohol dehydrogenase, partial [Acidobacteriota bacterium]|nr:polyvinylalcohol dehydrogenase [Acidobacteriota bacterium]